MLCWGLIVFLFCGMSGSVKRDRSESFYTQGSWPSAVAWFCLFLYSFFLLCFFVFAFCVLLCLVVLFCFVVCCEASAAVAFEF